MPPKIAKSNCMFTPTSENTYRFSVKFMLAKLSAFAFLLLRSSEGHYATAQ